MRKSARRPRRRAPFSSSTASCRHCFQCCQLAERNNLARHLSCPRKASRAGRKGPSQSQSDSNSRPKLPSERPLLIEQ
eukprot:8600625-Pyramimonas_sp.AAC.1